MLEIAIEEVLVDIAHDMGEAAALEKDGVERDLQELLAERPAGCGEGFRLVRREWPTDIGPVDLMCRDAADGWIAVEIKRVGTIDAVEQLSPLPRANPPRPGDERLPRRARRAADQAAGERAGRRARDRLRRGRPRGAARRARARADAVRAEPAGLALARRLRRELRERHRAVQRRAHDAALLDRVGGRVALAGAGALGPADVAVLELGGDDLRRRGLMYARAPMLRGSSWTQTSSVRFG